MTPAEIIQRRRAELGLTQTQLAERIGRTASTVRRWEHGDASPPRALLSTLAKALQVSDRDLAVAFGDDESADDESATTTEAPSTEAPSTEAPSTEAPSTEAPSTEAPSTEAPSTEAPSTEAPTTKAPQGEAAVEESGVGAAPGLVAIEEQPTVAVPVAAATVASSPQARLRRRSPMRRAPAVDPAEGLSYIENPRQRIRYWLRSALTIIVGIVLLFLLVWAFGELRTALSDVWDLFGDDAPPVTAPGTDF